MKVPKLLYLVLAIAIGLNIFFTYVLHEKIKQERKYDYPIKAHRILDLGNGWVTFRLRIAGRDRLFLRHVFIPTGSESLTELNLNAAEQKLLKDPVDK